MRYWSMPLADTESYAALLLGDYHEAPGLANFRATGRLRLTRGRGRVCATGPDTNPYGAAANAEASSTTDAARTNANDIATCASHAGVQAAATSHPGAATS